MLGAEFDDVPGQDRSHSGQGVELLLGRRAEADRTGRAGLTAPGAGLSTPRPTVPRTDGTGTTSGRTGRAHHDLFAVGQQARPVQPAGARSAQHPARGP